MRAVVFKGTGHVAVEERPIPQIQEPDDIIVKTQYTALCGSDLHAFRGYEASTPGYIMGHEFVGWVESVGDAVQTVKRGDRVVAPFTISCANCFYCENGFSSRCVHSRLFGSPALDGAQAEYIRVPLADGTVIKAPDGFDEYAGVLMGDIFPTGFFAALNGFKDLSAQQRSEAVVAVVGCGPVGLCAIIAALEYKPKHLFAIDSIPSRLELAQSLGAKPLNFEIDREGLDARIKSVTNGRGADVVLEVVGLSPALRLAFDILRPFGMLSSVGVHNAEIPWNGDEAYNKNIRLQMGRCPVRSIFPQALELLRQKQDQLGFMSDKIMPLSRAVEGYELFDQKKVQKIIFDATK